MLVAGIILLLAVGCSVTWLVRRPDGELLLHLDPIGSPRGTNVAQTSTNS